MTVLYIVSLKYTSSINKIEEHLPEHLEWIEKHYHSGHLIASGKKIPRLGSVLIARAESLLDLWDILNTDPFQINALVTTEVIVFEASKLSLYNLTKQ